MTPDELAYHVRVLAQLRSAQAAWDSWSRHLAEKYQLRQGDEITEHGEVIRGGEVDRAD